MLRFPVEGAEIGAVVFGTDLKIIAGIARFLSAAADEGAHVGFVGCFVVRKTGIAVDAIGHVAGGESGEGGIVGGHALCQAFDPRAELRLRGFALILVCGEPLAVVVGGQLAQKIDDGLHERRRSLELAKQFGAGVFAKFDDIFERVGLSVIRIGNGVLIGVLGEKI